MLERQQRFKTINLKLATIAYFCDVNKIILLGIASLIFSACSNKLAKSNINLQLHYTSDYCGGAAPSDEMIADLETPKWYNGTLYIHENKERNDHGISVLFEEGQANISGIAEGTYYVYRHPKMNIDSLYEATIKNFPMIDLNCLQDWQNKSLMSFTISKEIKSVSDTLYFECNPCEPPRP